MLLSRIRVNFNYYFYLVLSIFRVSLHTRNISCMFIIQHLLWSMCWKMHLNSKAHFLNLTGEMGCNLYDFLKPCSTVYQKHIYKPDSLALWLTCSKELLKLFGFPALFWFRVPADGYSRNTSCPINYIFTFLFKCSSVVTYKNNRDMYIINC